jgi:rubrerythrin
MAMSAEESMKILKTAIEIEENGEATFKRLAQETHNENGKRMFERLAADEREHRRILLEQMNALTRDGSWRALEIPKTAVEKVAPTIREKQQKTKGAAALGEIDALNTALDLERKAAGFFRDKAEEVDAPEAKSLFIRLAEWEDAHFELIQAELDSLKNTGLWFGIPEFRMDGTF